MSRRDRYCVLVAHPGNGNAQQASKFKELGHFRPAQQGRPMYWGEPIEKRGLLRRHDAILLAAGDGQPDLLLWPG